jgi:hypothetical protein
LKNLDGNEVFSPSQGKKMVLQEDHFSEIKPSTVTRIFAYPKGLSRLFEPRPAAAILGKLSVTPFASSAVTFWLPKSAYRRKEMARAFEQIAFLFRNAPAESGWIER